MHKLVLALTCLLSTTVSAQSVVLEDGRYDTDDSSICSARVVNDLSAKKIIMRGISVPGKHCGDTSTFNEMSWSKESDYLKVREIVIDEKILSDCAVVNGEKPCVPSELLYDKQNNLLLKLNDVLLEGGVLRVVNPRAILMFSFLKHTRNGIVLNSVDEQDKNILYKVD